MMNRLPTLVLLGVVAACQSPRAPTAPVTNTVPAHAEAAAQDVPLAEGVEVYAATKGDVDGDGTAEPVEVRSNGMLRVGGLTAPLPLERIDDPDYFQSQVRVSVEKLDGAHRVVVVATPTEGLEDPPPRYRVFVIEGGALAAIYDDAIAGEALRFPGDGTMRYDEGAWTACERAHYPPVPVGIDEVVLDRGADGRLAIKGQHASGRTFDCNNLAACPFVYAVDAHGAHRLGEVLRNLRGADAYALQSLAVPDGLAGAASDATDAIAIRISEEKPEVTFLDEVYVDVGGVRVEPRACSTAAPPAYCAADGVPYVLREGDVLDLDFAATVDGPTAVFARGYYVPGGGVGGPDTCDAAHSW